MIFPGTRSPRFDARSGLIGSPSCDVRNADGQTFSPVFELISSVPRIPGMTITGRFPVRARAEAKMCSRLGVRRAEIHALETRESAIRTKNKCRERSIGGLVNWHRPTTINKTRDESGAKAVIDIDYCYIRSAGVQHAEQRRDPSKRCSIPDTRWHSHHRDTYEPTNNRRQGAFHSCGDDDDTRTL